MASCTYDDDDRPLHNGTDAPISGQILLPAEEGYPSVDFSLGHERWKHHRVWDAYISASSVLLRAISNDKFAPGELIFPAMFNFRHAMEVALKWHIEYAGGKFPKNVGHKLDLLVKAFGDATRHFDTADEKFSECEMIIVLELADLDPRSIAFRYPSEINGSPISMPREKWDLHNIISTVEYISVWLDHLRYYIDDAAQEYQERLMGSQ